jgi:uncharacterized protein YecE (DUF72 family)
MAKGQIRIGTSGWHYGHWSGPFYPKGLPKKAFLDHYQRHFETVEINNSFYRLPAANTLQKWRTTVGSDFIFTVKASRYITHMKKLKDPQDAVDAFCGRIGALEPKLGPILFQLPPRWRFNSSRLDAFLASLPTQNRYAFEFRDPGWFCDRCLEILARHGAAFCIHELSGRTSPMAVTADFVYVRLHGPQEAYQGRYEASHLAAWAEALLRWAAQDLQIFCFFDNDEKGHAVRNARELKEMVDADSG